MRLPGCSSPLQRWEPEEYEQVRADRRETYEHLLTDDGHWTGAFDARRVLVRTGAHRAVGIADLLTAALAADHGLTVPHHDSDFGAAAAQHAHV